VCVGVCVCVCVPHQPRWCWQPLAQRTLLELLLLKLAQVDALKAAKDQLMLCRQVCYMLISIFVLMYCKIALLFL